MMRMLEAGGISALTDDVRKADAYNPYGYFEFEPVKRLAKDAEWVGDARGKAVKIIYPLLQYLPDEIEYRVLFMERDLKEMFASQRAMLLARGDEAAGQDEERVLPILRKEAAAIKEWLAHRPNMRTIYVPYGELIQDPAGWSSKVAHFLGDALDEAAMAAAVDPSLRHDWRLQSEF